MIAILMATYNGGRYLDSAILSILKQSYQDFILYIHDDGSDDNTLDIISYYLKTHPQKVKYIDGNTVRSATKNFLFMLESVRAKWYMFADQDDIWDERKVEVLIHRALCCPNSETSPLLLYSDLEVVDSNLNCISKSFYKYNRINPYKTKLSQVITQNVVPGCTCLFNEKLRTEALKYENIDNIRYHDWWLACVAAATGQLVYVNKQLVKYRQHTDNVVGAEKDGIASNINSVIRIFTSNQMKKSHIRIVRFVKQAYELKNVSFVNEEDRKMILNFHNFSSLNKLCRIKIFMQYGIRRSKRNAWMYLML